MANTDVLFSGSDFSLGAHDDWCTLSSAEWDYLLRSRSASTIGGVANARYAKVRINGVNGLLLFPDEFFWTETTMGPVPSSINGNVVGNCWNEGSMTEFGYSDSQLMAMEDEGAVFLPVTGYRNYANSQANLFDHIQNTGAGGFYWTSTIYGSVKARCVRFTASEVVIELGKERTLGYSVRLARKGRAF